MKKSLFMYAALVALPLLTVGLTTTPASADFCFQLDGGSFSGDIGFFRFNGARPVAPGQIVPLTGRAAGLSPAFGTATVGKDGSYAEYGATFFIDADQGQFDIAFLPPKSKSGSGRASFGVYGVSDSVTVTVVDCSDEP
jgi:hypothetical protein